MLILHAVQEYEHHEIATILGCSARNSKSQLYKARLRLRELLQEALCSRPREKRLSTGVLPAPEEKDLLCVKS